MFPEIWKFLHPFEERGGFKKEFKLEYTYPEDNGFER